MPSPHARSARPSSLEKAHLWRLPVPDLQRTLERYLTSLEPFLLEEAENGGQPFEEALAQRKAWWDAFVQDLGARLQQRLRVLDKQSPHNWLDDNIWLKVYHQWRAPLLVNSNWWAAFENDKNIPMDVLLGMPSDLADIANIGLTTWQIRRAAWLLHRALEFKAKVEKQELHPETTPNGVWLQSTFSRMYNTSRLPRLACDKLSTIPPPSVSTARAILLSVHDWFYAIEVCDEHGSALSAKALEGNILGAVRDVMKRLEQGERAVPVSVLSADERDKWAENQSYLLNLSSQNHATLEAINHAILAFSLDHYTYTPDAHTAAPPTPPPSPPLSPKARHPSAAQQPDSPAEIRAHLLNLRASHPAHPARNRWHDKTFTIVVEANTRAGAVGEHSPVDALVPNLVAEYACAEGVDVAAFKDTSGVGDMQQSAVGWRRLDWVVDEHIREECVRGQERAKAIADDSDADVLIYDTYGRDYIKAECDLPSDAFVQMAIQLAYYKVHRGFTATYETALTRMFANGRTEAIRTLTTASRAWVLAMADTARPVNNRRTLLQRAIASHTALSRAAASGTGIDRHLLGLRTLLAPWDGAAPELFQDALFARSQRWRLSTSSIGAARNLRGTGFGAIERDGYGINYIVKADKITFGVECKRSCVETSSEDLTRALREALDEMKEVCGTFPKAEQEVDEEQVKVRQMMDEFLAKARRI